MQIADHIAKFERTERALEDIDPHDCFELWLWSAQNGLTHLYNAVLHQVGLRREDDTFPSQVVGVHYQADVERSGFEKVLVDDADVLHTNLPNLDIDYPVQVEAGRRALMVIERLAAKYGRTDAEKNHEDIEAALAAYGECRESLLATA